jgi:hypothetical protein
MAHPARGDEMVNQESELVAEAEEHADAEVARSFRWVSLAPVASIGAGGFLLARGRRTLGIFALASGIAAGVGGLAFRFLRGHQERDEAMHDELETLDEERAAIETGRL